MRRKRAEKLFLRENLYEGLSAPPTENRPSLNSTIILSLLPIRRVD